MKLWLLFPNSSSEILLANGELENCAWVCFQSWRRDVKGWWTSGSVYSVNVTASIVYNTLSELSGAVSDFDLIWFFRWWFSNLFSGPFICFKNWELQRPVFTWVTSVSSYHIAVPPTGVRVLFSPEPCQNLLFIVFLMLAMPTAVSYTSLWFWFLFPGD